METPRISGRQLVAIARAKLAEADHHGRAHAAPTERDPEYTSYQGPTQPGVSRLEFDDVNVLDHLSALSLAV